MDVWFDKMLSAEETEIKWLFHLINRINQESIRTVMKRFGP